MRQTMVWIVLVVVLVVPVTSCATSEANRIAALEATIAATEQERREEASPPTREPSPTPREGITETPRECQSVELPISASIEWTDSGMDVDATDFLYVNAEGTIQYDSEGHLTGPEGVGETTPVNDPNFPVGGLPYIALIGKIGESGDPFFVGPWFRGVAGNTGRLFLGPNECARRIGCYSDNRGAWTAIIQKCWYGAAQSAPFFPDDPFVPNWLVPDWRPTQPNEVFHGGAVTPDGLTRKTDLLENREAWFDLYIEFYEAQFGTSAVKIVKYEPHVEYKAHDDGLLHLMIFGAGSSEMPTLTGSDAVLREVRLIACEGGEVTRWYSEQDLPDQKVYHAMEQAVTIVSDRRTSHQEKRERLSVVQDNVGLEVFTTMVRLVPICIEDGCVSFDTYARNLVRETGMGLNEDDPIFDPNSPFSRDPVGATIQLLFDPTNARQIFGME